MTSQFQILNKVLQNKDMSLITLNNLTENHFFNYRNEFKFIVDHYNKFGYNVPDTLTFLTAFPDFVIQEVNEPDTALIFQLMEDYKVSQLASTFNSVKRFLENGKTDAAIECAKKAIEGITSGTAITSYDLLDPTERYNEYLEKLNGGASMFYLSTGFTEIDEATGGIDRRNENMVIAARTGVGKSWTLIKMITAAYKQGLRVGLYSGEMTPDKVGYRFDTLMGGVDNKAITRGNRDAEFAYRNYIENLKSTRGSNACVKVITPATISGPATVDALRAFIEKEQLNILFIDQYSLLEDTSNARVAHERVANISKAIKNLQVMKQIPIISVAQMNRTKNEDGSLDTSQIGLSDRIPQDCTTLIMLDRDLKDRSIITFDVQKARDGGEGRYKYHCDFNTGTFEYLEEEENETAETDEANDAENAKYCS